MPDNRGPKTRFFDDLADIHQAACVAQAFIEWQLDRSRAIEFDRERMSYTLIFQSDGLDHCSFVLRDLIDRARNLSLRADELFPDDDKDAGDRSNVE
jgi:hypothetical protein